MAESRNTDVKRLAEVQSLVTLAEAHRELESEAWDEAYCQYTSFPKTVYPDGQAQFYINLVWAWVETILPSLSFNNPGFIAEPTNEKTEAAAATTQAAVNEELRLARLRPAIEKCAFDMMLFGTGVPQLGYYSNGLVPDVAAGEMTPSELEKAEKKRKPGPQRVSSDLAYGLRPESLYVLSHRPQDFFMDPNATSIEDALFCGISYTRRLDDVKKDPNWIHGSGVSDLVGDTYAPPKGATPRSHLTRTNRNAANSAGGSEEDLLYVTLYQFWDIVRGRVYTFTMDHPMFLQKKHWTLPTRRFPFYPFQGTVNTLKFWVDAPCAPWLTQVNEYNRLLSERFTHLRAFKRKYVYDRNAVNRRELEILKAPIDGLCIPVDPGGGDVRQVVAPLLDANISPDHWRQSDELYTRWQQVAGVNNMDMGGMTPGERPALEIQTIKGGSNTRKAALMGRIRNPLEDLAEDARRIMEHYYQRERVVRILGGDGDVVWQPYKGSDLSGDYGWKCKIEEASPKDPTEESQTAAVVLNLAIPLQHLINIRPLIKNLFKLLETDVEFLPQAAPAPREPNFEWHLIRTKSHDIVPHDLESHSYHLEQHTKQLGSQEALQDSVASQLLRNHIERHSSMLEAQLADLEAQQQSGGGSPPAQAGGPLGNQNNAAGLNGEGVESAGFANAVGNMEGGQPF